MTPQEKAEIEEIRGRVKDGCRKLLDLMHHKLDLHFDSATGKPKKEISEATCKMAKIVFDQCRREAGHNKPPAELEDSVGGVPSMPGNDEVPGNTSPLSKFKFKVVSDESQSKTG